ncbi:hypothetical protein PI124_g15726 [Phytophthora idaei]|nr:hypothetical protein PI125_g15832 [Phytophthora idaei]KAG3142924.1 hypothetical protein PI126_g14848 [Phytophthora idaei]KAG3239356.1 hypothetical protein PI124_g15726 [Phytophthora idaei]
MLSRTIRQVASQAKRQGARMASTKRSSVNGKGALDDAYKGVYGSATNYIWEASNRGRLYHHIDWSKFAEEEEEEEDEEEEEEEEEDAHEDDEE